MMALVRSFKDTVKARVERDPAFHEALLTEAIERCLSGEVDIWKALLHDIIEPKIGFERLAVEMGRPPKSLTSMLTTDADPTASDTSGHFS